MGKFFLFPALIKSVQNCPMASEPLIGCTPGAIKMASLVYSAGKDFPFILLYAADHSLFAASIAALILSWAHAVGAVNSTTKIAEEIACFIFMVLPGRISVGALTDISSFDEGQRPSHGSRCGHQYDRGCEHQTEQT